MGEGHDSRIMVHRAGGAARSGAGLPSLAAVWLMVVVSVPGPWHRPELEGLWWARTFADEADCRAEIKAGRESFRRFLDGRLNVQLTDAETEAVVLTCRPLR